ncbi:50S ribosomal protein L23 [Candidiatus Paracoxiella cheracis]|uniref:50S ribosomal protein L23 n=1 Tax=Candidiatus Paracoxiella cheracis TaxID=3405120 RepID=UPI003BF4865A
MSAESILTILRAPHVSEKTVSSAGVYPQYAFEVSPAATKAQIKEAVEALFNVTVKSVRTINVKGKQTRFKQTRGRRNNWKKAYVTLAQGSEIDVAYGD